MAHSNYFLRQAICAAMFCGLCAFANPAFAQQPSANARQQQNIQVMAVVNGQEITRQKIATECLRRFGKDVLQNIVNKKLVQLECQARGINITEGDVNNEIKRRAEGFDMSANGLIKLICSQRNINVDQYKNNFIWRQLALRSLAAEQVQVTREEIAERMESQYGAKVEVRQIAVNNQQDAERILTQARQNPDSFERLAQDHSLDLNSAPLGGLLPPIRRFSGLPELENVAFSLKPGQVSDVFKIQDKFLILKCEKYHPAMQLRPEDIAIAQQQLTEQIGNEKLTTVATDLYAKLQNKAKLVNVYNNPELSKEMPGVAAIVNGIQIFKKDLAEECITHFGTQMLEAEIMRTILIQALQQANVQVTEADINAEITRAAQSRGHVNPDGSINEQAWLNYIVGGDTSKVDFYIEDILWPETALKKLVRDSVTVTDEDMKKGFEANYGPRVRYLAIFCNDQRKAFRVWKMATDNPNEEFFGKLANQHSVEPSTKALSGKAPPLQMHGGRPELEKEAFSLQPNQISQVVQVDDHWMIMYCLGRTNPVVQDFDAVKSELHANILEKKIRLEMGVRFSQLKTAAQIDNFMAGTSQSGRQAVRSAQNPAAGQNPGNGNRR